jgi:hypothetical protein
MTSPDVPTDWSEYDVPALAAMLAEDHSLAWDQVIAWRTSYELLSDESARLVKARAELADAWPPERSPAAAMYLSYLDLVIQSMADTGEAAITNSTSLSGVLLALAEAKAAIDRLHSTWQTYAAREQFNADPQRQPAYETAPTNWAQALNAQAHQHMAATDHTIFDNARRLITPNIMIFGREGESITPLVTPDPGQPPIEMRSYHDDSRTPTRPSDSAAGKPGELSNTRTSEGAITTISGEDGSAPFSDVGSTRPDISPNTSLDGRKSSLEGSLATGVLAGAGSAAIIELFPVTAGDRV